MKEPIVRFFLIGIAIFAVDRGLATRAAPEDPHTIVISDAFVEGLRARHTETTGVEADVDALVRDAVREEALQREARAAGLDDGDPIVRRRLVQKLEFVVAGMAETGEPTDEELQAFVEEHPRDFETAARTTLVHVHFRRARADAIADARAARAVLLGEPERADPEALGDPFLGGHRLGPAADARIDAVLGPGVAARIADLEVGSWSEPIEGALGVHLVRVIAREPRSMPALDAVRGRARDAWIEARRRELTERELARIVGTYTVVREGE